MPGLHIDYFSYHFIWLFSGWHYAMCLDNLRNISSPEMKGCLVIYRAPDMEGSATLQSAISYFNLLSYAHAMNE